MMRSQTALFRKKVGDVMEAVPMTVSRHAPVGEVVTRMTADNVPIVLVVDGDSRVLGIVTERDITSRVAFKLPADAPVEAVMTQPVQTIADGDYLYHAIAQMRKFGLRYLPIIDADEVAIGILGQHDAFAKGVDRLTHLIDRLTEERSLKGMKKVKKKQVDLAWELQKDNLPAPEIQGLLTDINNDIYRRIVDATLRDMEAEGWGTPPVPFTVIVMGSGGRGENYLTPDQDNGFIIADYPDRDHNRIDSFFIEVAERMCRDLDEVGFPYCNGYCMAVNPLWRKTLSQWKEQVSLWGRKRNQIAIRLSDIFYDFQPVWGDRAMAEDLRAFVGETVRANHFFLQTMAAEEADHNVALGLFGGFSTEKKDKKHKGKINLKHAGTIPLVEAVRLMALRHGVAETSTWGRLDGLLDLGVLDGNDHQYLSEAFAFVTMLLLRQQIRDFRKGDKVSNFVSPKKLSKLEKDMLQASLKAIDGFRKRIRAEFTGDIF